MRQGQPNRIAILHVLLLILAVPILGADSVDNPEPATIDYGLALVSMTLHSEARQDERNRLSQTSRQSTELVKRFPSYYPALLGDLRLDSRTLLGDLLKADPALQERFVAFARSLPPVTVKPSSALNAVELTWNQALFPDLYELLADQGYNAWKAALPRTLLPRTTPDVSSIVFFAPTPLPWHGMQQDAKLLPALFPAIRTAESLDFLKLGNLDPKAVQRWGMVRYTTEAEIASLGERLGSRPYYIRPIGIYGHFPVDLMISNADRDTLTASKSAQEAIRAGRIIIVVDPQVLDGN